MTLILIGLPLLISSLIGFLLLRRFFKKKDRSDLIQLLFLAGGLGLGTSAALTFLSFIFFNQFNRLFIISIHMALLLGLGLKELYDAKKERTPLLSFRRPEQSDLMILAALTVILLPLYLYASYYPYGGWDAWSCWNLKARFLYLGDENWKNMFDPILWRASPHYPLLLPLIHVWTWSFLPAPLELAPMTNSIFFTILTAGLLMTSLKLFLPVRIAILSGLLFLTLPFYNKLAISQYSDIVLSYYLLATVICLIQAKLQKSIPFAISAGLFLGFLSFTKPEGAIASLLLFMLMIPYFLWKEKDRTLANQQVKNLIIAATVASIPTILFQLEYSPGNQTFINGLTSAEKPADIYRFKFIFAYFYAELTSEKWHMLWGLMAMGIILGRKRNFARQMIIIPVFLLAYTGIITAYYFLNTYFKIEWWMQVTLNRILFSLLPVVIFWIFYSLWKREDTGQE